MKTREALCRWAGLLPGDCKCGETRPRLQLLPSPQVNPCGLLEQVGPWKYLRFAPEALNIHKKKAAQMAISHLRSYCLGVYDSVSEEEGFNIIWDIGNPDQNSLNNLNELYFLLILFPTL